MLQIAIITSILLGTTLAELSPCIKTFTLYKGNNVPITNFSESPSHPPQFAFSKSYFASSNLKLTFDLCGSDHPPFQSVNYAITKNGAPLSSAFVTSVPYSIPANFLRTAGNYIITAQAHSQEEGYGLLLAEFTIVIYVYRGCERSFVVYNTDNQTEVARFPFFGLGSDVNGTFGTIDQLQVGTGGMNMVSQFCNSNIQSVKYQSNGFPMSVDNLPPFSIGGKSNGTLLPSSLLAHLGTRISIDAFAFSGLGGQGQQLDHMRIFLTILAPSQVTSLTLVDVSLDSDVNNSSTDVATNFRQIDLAAYPRNETFTIRANTRGPLVSVAFLLMSRNFTYLRVTSRAPHALAGLTPDFQDYYPSPYTTTPGIYTLMATPYTGFNRTGTPGSASSIYFEVLVNCRVSGLTWIDVNAGSDIAVYSVVQPSTISSMRKLPDHDTLVFEVDPTLYSFNSTFTVRADVFEGDVKSVEFKLFKTVNGTKSLLASEVDSNRPFALGGGTRASPVNPVSTFQIPGTYYLEITPYSSIRKKGIQGTTKYATITIRSSIRVSTVALVNAVTGVEVGSLVTQTNNVVQLNRLASDATLDIRATTVGVVGCVDFQLFRVDIAVAVTRNVDNRAPYSLGGSQGVPFLLFPGSYYLVVTPYSLPNRRGILGEPKKFNLSVV